VFQNSYVFNGHGAKYTPNLLNWLNMDDVACGLSTDAKPMLAI